jgi:hypothetical protein
MVSDREAALSVENDIVTNPATLANFDIAEDQDTVIAGCPFAKSVVTSYLPSVGQQVTDGDMTTKFLSHFATQIRDERTDSASKVQLFSFSYRRWRPVTRAARRVARSRQ